MEKLGYYLDGREFVLVSDYESIEEIRNKIEFGNARISRWFERLKRFNYKPEYKKDIEIIHADALNRAPGGDSTSEGLSEILRIHEELTHRKEILKKIEAKSLEVTKTELDEAINRCVWKKKDKTMKVV